jgi:hypothetical protein
LRFGEPVLIPVSIFFVLDPIAFLPLFSMFKLVAIGCVVNLLLELKLCWINLMNVLRTFENLCWSVKIGGIGEFVMNFEKLWRLKVVVMEVEGGG